MTITMPNRMFKQLITKIRVYSSSPAHTIIQLWTGPEGEIKQKNGQLAFTRPHWLHFRKLLYLNTEAKEFLIRTTIILEKWIEENLEDGECPECSIYDEGHILGCEIGDTELLLEQIRLFIKRENDGVRIEEK